MVRTGGIFSRNSVIYRTVCKLRISYGGMNGFCNMVESPELPVWVKSPQNKCSGSGRCEVENDDDDDDDDDDFVLPTKFDSLGEWKLKARVEIGRTHVYDAIATGEFLVDSHADVDVIGGVLKRKFASPEAVVEALSGFSVNLSKDVVEKLLRRFNNDWISAFGFFNWSDSQSGYNHSTDSYNAMVDILGKAKRFDLMWNLVDEMVRLGDLVSQNTMGKVMRRLAGAGKWDDAVEVFQVIERLGVKKDTISMNLLLDALCKENSVKRASAVFMEYRDRIPPNASSFNILIHGWCMVNKLKEARLTMEEMRNFGFEPCVISYTCLIEACCKVKNFREVHSIMDEMQSKGCPPNIITYTIVMHALGKAKETQEALLIYDKMKMSNCTPDAGFYNSLITILGRAGRLQDTYDIFLEMNRNGISPDVTTYNTMISTACNHFQEETAFKLLQKMEESSCKPNLKTFTSLLKMGSKKKVLKLLNYLLDYMHKKDINLDLGTYTLLVHGLCRNGNLEQACLLFEEMVFKGLLPRNQTYTMLILGLQRRKMEKTKQKIQQLMAMAHGSTRCKILSTKTVLGIDT